MNHLIPTGGKRSRRGYIWSRLSVLDIGGRTNLTLAELGMDDIRTARARVAGMAGSLFGTGCFESLGVESLGVVTVKRLKMRGEKPARRA